MVFTTCEANSNALDLCPIIRPGEDQRNQLNEEEEGKREEKPLLYPSLASGITQHVTALTAFLVLKWPPGVLGALAGRSSGRKFACKAGGRLERAIVDLGATVDPLAAPVSEGRYIKGFFLPFTLLFFIPLWRTPADLFGRYRLGLMSLLDAKPMKIRLRPVSLQVKYFCWRLL